ncbi:MAG: IS1634 family transposase, partial [Actinomycetota bacterium]|nr:IS1634 family transposase [Actinomycetota bacterium]
MRPGVVGARSQLLWDVLAGAYGTLGFDAVGDEAFKALVLARIVEPTSKADTVGVLAEIGVAGPSLRTMFRSLRRAVDGDYRDTLAKPCLVHSAKAGRASLVLYDVTTL